MSEQQPSPAFDDDEISLLDLMVTLADNLWLLILGPLAAGLVALGISFTMTPVFTAKTTVLPPAGGSGGTAAALLGQLGGLGGLVGGGLSGAASKHMAYLDSDLIRDQLIAKFGLQKRFEKETLTETRKALADATKIADDKKTGVINIEVTDVDPVMAAQMANAYVEALRQVMGQEALDQARQRRTLLERQIEEATRKSYQSPQVRDAVIQSLIRQFEATKLEEQQTEPQITQVDVAKPPEFKSAPKKALIAVLTTLATGFLLLLFVFVRQALRNAGSDPEAASKLRRIRARLGLKG
jgi:uncharacterized protein involved in exopolysaccharide biosynthesis